MKKSCKVGKLFLIGKLNFVDDVWILGERERFGSCLETLNYENLLTEPPSTPNVPRILRDISPRPLPVHAFA